MDCLVLILKLCFFDPSNVYLSGTYDYAVDSTEESRVVWDGTQWIADRSYASNDRARASLGWVIDITDDIRVDLGFTHVSMPSRGDRGYNAASFSVVWRPFR